MGGGYIPQNLEDTASLSIRDPSGSSGSDTGWSNPAYDQSTDSFMSSYADAVDQDAIAEASVTFQAVEGDAGVEIIAASAAAGPEATVAS